uniref:Uncharacterized protein n=1 Tax=Heterosigma akashiwo TaxID=2829 RepID=A0A7S4D4Y1_HETAK
MNGSLAVIVMSMLMTSSNAFQAFSSSSASRLIQKSSAPYDRQSSLVMMAKKKGPGRAGASKRKNKRASAPKPAAQDVSAPSSAVNTTLEPPKEQAAAAPAPPAPASMELPKEAPTTPSQPTGEKAEDFGDLVEVVSPDAAGASPDTAGGESTNAAEEEMTLEGDLKKWAETGLKQRPEITGELRDEYTPKFKPMRVEMLRMAVEQEQYGKFRDFDTGKDVTSLPADPEKKFRRCFPEGPGGPVGGPARLPVACSYQDLVVNLDDAVQGGPEALSAFVVDNKDLLGVKARKVLTSLKLRAQQQFDKNKARYYDDMRRALILKENTLMAPFRLLMMRTEERLAPMMGNMEPEKWAGQDRADYLATWLLLKAAVAEWEKRRAQLKSDIEFMETVLKNVWLTEGREQRQLESAEYMCALVQGMSLKLAERPELFDQLPPEARFLEQALRMNTGTEVRQYALQEFLPREGLDGVPELVARVRALGVATEFLSAKTFTSINVAIEEVVACLTAGTPEQADLYVRAFNTGNIGFRTYKVTIDKEYEDALDPQNMGTNADLAPDVRTIEQDYRVVYDALLQSVGLPFRTRVPPADAADSRDRDLGWFHLLDENYEEHLGVEDEVREETRRVLEEMLKDGRPGGRPR